jgi:hypothetical protein
MRGAELSCFNPIPSHYFFFVPWVVCFACGWEIWGCVRERLECNVFYIDALMCDRIG